LCIRANMTEDTELVLLQEDILQRLPSTLSIPVLSPCAESAS